MQENTILTFGFSSVTIRPLTLQNSFPYQLELLKALGYTISMATIKKPTPAQLAYWQSRKVLTPDQEASVYAEYHIHANLTTYSRPTLKALAIKYKVSEYVIFRIVNTHLQTHPQS